MSLMNIINGIRRPGSSFLSRNALLSFPKSPSPTSDLLGVTAAQWIKRLLRPRGHKAGIRHRPIYKIQTVVTARPYRAPLAVRDRQVNAPINRLPLSREKLRLNCALWNARSLSGKTASLSTLIVEQRLDIVFLTETWLKCQNDPVILDLLTSVTGFVFHHRPRTQRNLKQHVSHPTHDKGHALDLVISRIQNELISNITTNEELHSDHKFVQFLVNVRRPPNIKKQRTSRAINSINKLTLQSKIEEAFSAFEVHRDPNDLHTIYEENMRNILDELAPIVSKTVIVKPRALWYSNHAEELNKLKASVRKLLEYCRRIDGLKSDYHCSRIEQSDTKGLFSIIDDLTGNKKTGSVVLRTNIEASELCDAFAKYFHDKVSTLREGLIPKLVSYSPPKDAFSEFCLLSEHDVIKTVNTSSTKSCELDILHTCFVKDNITVLAPFLTCIFNSSLLSGVVPQGFKCTFVRPLLKKVGLDHNVLKNYRPVSNLSFLSKTLERLVARQLHKYLSRNHLLAKFQSAYRENHSTETAILKVHTDIMNALNMKKDVILVTLDLSAAFDTLDHNVLLHRLEHRFGVTGTVLKWFRSYLSNRTQCISISSLPKSKPMKQVSAYLRALF